MCLRCDKAQCDNAVDSHGHVGVFFALTLWQALRQEEASESQSMAEFLGDLVSKTLTDKVSRLYDKEKCTPTLPSRGYLALFVDNEIYWRARGRLASSR